MQIIWPLGVAVEVCVTVGVGVIVGVAVGFAAVIVTRAVFAPSMESVTVNSST